MNFSVFLGQYIPRKSLIHSLNPIIKMIVFSILIVTVFLIGKIQVLMAVSLFVVLLAYASKIGLGNYLKTNKILLFLALIISISNFLFMQYINITSGGFFNNLGSSLLIFIRIFLLTIINSVFLFTTSNSNIIRSVEFILFPLKCFKINTQKIALTIAMAIKFLPIMFERFNKIILTQKSRGADFETKKTFKKHKIYLKAIVPLPIFMLRKSKNMAAAMFSRCYNLEGQRTKFMKIKIKKYDIIFLIVSTIIIIGVIICNSIIK